MSASRPAIGLVRTCQWSYALPNRSPLRVPSNRRCPHVPSPSIRVQRRALPSSSSCLLATAVPASAAGPGVRGDHDASPPFEVTVGQPIAYVVTVTNNTNNVLNRVQRETTSPAAARSICTTILSYTGSPSSCSQHGAASCVFDNLPSGATATAVSSYYQAPATPGELHLHERCPTSTATRRMPNATHNDTVEALITTDRDQRRQVST